MAASLLGLVLAIAPAQAQSHLDGPTFPDSAPVPGLRQVTPDASGVTLTFHKASAPAAPPSAEQTLHFHKEAPAAKEPTAWNASSPVLPPHRPNPLLALQAAKPDPAPRVAKGGSEESLQYQIPLELPGKQVLFGKLDTEEELKERMRQDARNQNPDNRIVFPDEPVISKEKYKGRSFPPAAEVAEPYYVCHRRLLFEEINSERYGWDLGAAQPLVSVGTFAFNLVTVPYHMFTRPCEKFECSAGYCLPGDPVPYLLYPPEISVTGAAAEGLAAFGGLWLFP